MQNTYPRLNSDKIIDTVIRKNAGVETRPYGVHYPDKT